MSKWEHQVEEDMLEEEEIEMVEVEEKEVEEAVEEEAAEEIEAEVKDHLELLVAVIEAEEKLVLQDLHAHHQEKVLPLVVQMEKCT